MSAAAESVVVDQSAYPYFLRDEFFPYVTSAVLFLLALGPIWVGALRSVADMARAKKKDEIMAAKDAAMFPVYGSCFLFGLYLLFRFFNKDYVNLLLLGYFVLVGEFALLSTIKPYLLPYLPASLDTKHKFDWSFHLPAFITKEPIEIKFSLADVCAGICAAVLLGWYVSTKHWVANNVIGLAFSLQAIEIINVGSYKNSCILLWGLFIYDVFWVFGTDVMVTVAKSFDAPIKLVFPKSFIKEPLQLSLLGLGDIVIPGIFVALMARFDAVNARESLGAKFNLSRPFPRPYFHATFIGYIVGLLATMFVMHYFKAAQPALLYLVPSIIGASLIVALAKGQLAKLFNYSEEASDESSSNNNNNNKTKKTK